MTSVRLIPPYGGELVDLLVEGEERAELIDRAHRLPSVQLSPRAMCDLEMLATGAFSPLRQFMGMADYRRVLEEMRLADGTLFPIPITLTLPRNEHLSVGREIALRTCANLLVAVMNVEDIFVWDRQDEARQVLGTNDYRHPLVAEMSSCGEVAVSGPLRVVQLPKHYDFSDLRLTPS
jgi:sulfate adenylyltransferase